MKKIVVSSVSSSSNKFQSVLARASKMVTPDAAEVAKLHAVALKVEALLSEVLNKEDAAPRPEIALGGSYARGTWLKGNHDIDFFLLYPVEFSREKLESVAIRSATEAVRGFHPRLRYAEHPYVEAFVDNIRVNLVPCYKVSAGQWQSAADRSPFHTKYIASKLDEKLKLEARLFKKFVKTLGVYGAEVKVQGFSGYACELLTIWRESFLGTLEGLSKLKAHEVISLEEYDKDLAASFHSPLILLDPVDTTRNLGSAISARNVAKLVLASRRFLLDPKLSFFETKEEQRISLNPKKKELLSRVVVLSFRNEARSPDILWGQLRRSASAVSDKLTRAGFQILRSTAASDEKTRSALIFFVAETRLGKLQSRKGPEYYREQEVFSYLTKNQKKAFVIWFDEDGRMEALFERDQNSVDVQRYLANMLSEKMIGSVGLSEEIRKEIGKRHQLSNGAKIFRRSKGKADWLTTEIFSLISEE